MARPSAPPHLVVIANPAAGRGRGRALLPALERSLVQSATRSIPFTLHVTTRAGEETVLAREAAEAGAATILAAGGDGTWGNVARGIMQSGQTPRLALLATGTGNDLAFATCLHVHDVEAAVQIAVGRGERRIDVGDVDGVHFVNCVGFGFDAEVVRASRGVRWLHGHALYLLTAARLLLRYRGFAASLSWDEGERGSTPDGAPLGAASPAHHLAVIIANGPRFGGGFVIAPGAQVDDGTLDLIRVADGSAWRRMVVFASATRGRHLIHPEVMHRQVHDVTLAFDAPPWFEADGELHRAPRPVVRIRVRRAALRLAVPEGAEDAPG